MGCPEAATGIYIWLGPGDHFIAQTRTLKYSVLAEVVLEPIFYDFLLKNFFHSVLQ